VVRAAPLTTETADIMVVGHYARDAGRASLFLTVRGQAQSPLNATLSTTLGNDTSMIDSVRGLAGRLQAVVSVSAAPPGQNDVPMSEMAAPPASYEAFARFQEGQHYFDVADWRRALRLLKGAAGRDSGFAMALIMAVRAHAAAGDVDSAKVLISALERRALLPYDRAYFKTVVFRLEGQMAGYLHSSLHLLKLAPGSEFAAATAVAAAYRAGRPRLADSLIRNVPLPDRFDDVGYPAFTYHVLGDHARELMHLENVHRDYPRSTLVLGHEAAAFAALHRPAEVDRVLAAMAAPEGGSPGNWMRATAAEYEVHGQPRDAARLRERAVAWFSLLGDSIRRSPTIRVEEGAALLAAGHLGAARTVYRDALPLVTGLTNTITIHGSLGLIAARLADNAAATQEEKWLARQPRDFTKGYADVWRARIALAKGDTARAATLLQMARSAAFPEIDGEQSVDPLHQIPELRGLR
jgi:tetratricopeptide (TPR) repeat protein